MKFKAIFILFNTIIVGAFLFVFLMPLFVIGGQASFTFWKQNWYLILIFLMILAGLDSYFLRNWKLFSSLEKEDWSGLLEFLRTRIFIKKNLSEQNIRLYCNAAVLVGKSEAILELASFLEEKHKKIYMKHGLLLGLPLLLKQDGRAMETFYRVFVDETKKINSEQLWYRFFLAFALLSQNKFEDAKPLLGQLSKQKTDRVVQLASMQLGLTSEGTDAEANALRTEFINSISRSSIEKIIEGLRENLHIMLLSKFLTEAVEVLYRGSTNGQVKVDSEIK